jgi:hypothetical protein
MKTPRKRESMAQVAWRPVKPKCQVGFCRADAYKDGLCKRHQVRKLEVQEDVRPKGKCLVKFCTEDAFRRGLCRKHQMKKLEDIKDEE